MQTKKVNKPGKKIVSASKKSSARASREKPEIASEVDYSTVMSRIDKLMSKGSKNVSKKELAEIRTLALVAQAYEQKKYKIELPSTFAGLLEMKMYENNLKQTELAKKLHISDAKLSLIMSGKQKPDVLFLKAVHKELHVDANLLLEAV
jgi:HTH-type transcriptional regulator/antitoxin HigA